MRIISLLLLVFCALTISIPAQACGPEGNTPEKLAQRQKEFFTRTDANHDGLLSLQEYLTMPRYMIGQKQEEAEGKFKSMDKDNSGALTFHEWAEVNKPHFFALDGGC